MRDMLTYNYGSDPVGISRVMERAIKAFGVKLDRNEVLAMTAKIMARRVHKGNDKKARFQDEQQNKEVRSCLAQYAGLE
jgi:hypothetical protein